MASSRDVAKERYWRGVIRRFEASGLGVRRFCEREKISEDRMYWWRRTLRRRDQDQARCPGRGKTGKSVRGSVVDPGRCKTGKSVRGGVVDPRHGKASKSVRGKAVDPVRGGMVGPVHDKAGGTAGAGSDTGNEAAFLPIDLPISMAGPIEVVHPHGHVIRLPLVFDSEALGRILAAIDSSAGSSGTEVT